MRRTDLEQMQPAGPAPRNVRIIDDQTSEAFKRLTNTARGDIGEAHRAANSVAPFRMPATSEASTSPTDVRTDRSGSADMASEFGHVGDPNVAAGYSPEYRTAIGDTRQGRRPDVPALIR